MRIRIHYLSARGMIVFSIVFIFQYFQEGMSVAKPYVFIAIACLILFVLTLSKPTVKDKKNNSIKKIK